MSKQITAILKRKLEEITAYGEVNAETARNSLKEELQFYVLNFIYHKPEYNNWIMYGGSSLRIIHGLDRMSVDLDFEVPHEVTDKYLEVLKKKTEDYFMNTYGASAGFLTIKITTGRGLLLRFKIDDELKLEQHSKQIHVKIDLNHFVAPNVVTERRPINHDQLSFVIITYNMGTLMASKLAAIFLRGSRGVGKVIYEEKGRDIYDLLWYMGKKAVPDFDYLMAKGIDLKDPRTLFDKLTIQMNKVSDENLEQDLTNLFVDHGYIKNWLKNWRESYLSLLDGYEINTVTRLENLKIQQDFGTDNVSFVYSYGTETGKIVRIIYTISEYWLDGQDEDFPSKIDDQVVGLIEESIKDQTGDKIKQFASLFYKKTESYFAKTSQVILGNNITTKIIRMTTTNLNQKEQIVLNKSALLTCELDDLLK
ncbi:MAG: nucleotidyl transferase AbiEii/AbiGii toxin family protein [bacterium]